MEWNASNSWNTGLYGTAVPEIWNFFCENSRYRYRYSLYKKESMTVKGDGNVLFHGNSQYDNWAFGKSDAALKKYRRGMYNFIVWNLDCIFEKLRYSTNITREVARAYPNNCTSIAQLREFAVSELGKNTKLSEKFTLEDVIFFAEYVIGDKDKKNLLKHYSQKTIDNVIGRPADPFTAVAIDTLMAKIEELAAMKGREVSDLVSRQTQERKELETKWDVQINEIAGQIEELKKANQMAMSEAV